MNPPLHLPESDNEVLTSPLALHHDDVHAIQRRHLVLYSGSYRLDLLHVRHYTFQTFTESRRCNTTKQCVKHNSLTVYVLFV